MLCLNCNHSNRPTAKICAQCGQPLSLLQNRYRLDRKLGQGGMGAVYLATDTRIDRQVVVKEMLPSTDPNEFRREAEVLAKLRHDNIPTITDYFDEKNKYYLVMDWIDGQDLEQRLTQRGAALGQVEVIQYASQILDALEYLARQQPPVVHRDLKPANIIVDQNGKAYLVDFGIARAKPTSIGAPSRDTSAYGTEGYAPPEQYAAKTESRSDIYALGATIHHLLTNRDPRDPQHKKFAPLIQLVPYIEPRLAQLVAQMLNDDVTTRPNATQAKQKLDAIFPPTVSVNIPLRLKAGGTFTLTTIESIVRFADQHWQEAVGRFFARDFEVWLGSLQRPNLIALAERIRLQYAQQPNRGMELFLEHCERAFVPRPHRPHLAIQPSTLDFGELFEDTQRQISLRNDGGGYLFGTLATNADWFSLSLDEFEGNKEHVVEIKTALSKLQLGQPCQDTIVIESNDRRYELNVAVTRVNADVYIQRGLENYRAAQLSLAQRLTAARRNFAAARTCRPTDTQTAFTSAALAVTLCDQGAWDEFFSWCEQKKLALEHITLIQPQFPLANLAAVCRKWGDELYRRARQNPTRDQFARVIEWYEHARQLDKNAVTDDLLAPAYVDLALTVCQSAIPLPFRVATADFEFAISQYRRAQKIHSAAAPSQELANMYLQFALAADRVGESARATTLSQTAFELAPNDVEISRTHTQLGLYTRREKQAKTWLGVSIGVSTGIGVMALLLALLPFFKWQPLANIILVSVSALAVVAATLCILFWHDRRWLLGLGERHALFVGGILASAALWIATVLMIGFVSTLMIARVTVHVPNLRLIAEFGWLVLFGVGILLFIVESRREPNRGQFLRVGFISAAAGIGFVLGIVGGFLFNGAEYRYAVAQGLDFVYGLFFYGNALVRGILVLVIGGLLFFGIRDKTRLTIQILLGALGLALAIALVVFPVFIALWEQWFLEWAWSAAIAGAFLAIVVFLGRHHEHMQSNPTNPIRLWWVSALLASFALGVMFLLTMQSRGALGLLAAMILASVSIGLASFVTSYASGPRLTLDTSRMLLTRARIIGLGILLVGSVILGGAELMVTRILERVTLYEHGQVLLAQGDVKGARSVFKNLKTLDPNFENVQTLARNVNLKITKRVEPTAAPAGAVITYTIVLENEGSQDANDVSIRDVLPLGITVMHNNLPQDVQVAQSNEQTEIRWKGIVRAKSSLTIPIQVWIQPIVTPLSTPAQRIVNRVSVDDGAGGVLTGEVIFRVLPTLTPTQTPTPTNTPRATATPTFSRTPTRTPMLEPSATPSPLPTAAILTTASNAWSDVQGKDGWWYEEGRTGDWANWQEMQWDPQFANCPNGCWRSNAAPSYVRLDQYGGHPGPNRYVGKRWRSEIEGNLRVRVTAYLGNRGGNGVMLRIVKNGQVIEQRKLDGNQTRARAVEFEFETPITVAGWIMCTVDADGNTDNDYTFFDIAISKVE